MSLSRVALVRCTGYDENLVYEAVKTGLNWLGGTSQFVLPGEKIVMKPNVLIGTNPDKCATTHPIVLKAVGRLLLEAGAELSYGDSSGIGSCEFNMRRSGLATAGDELGIPMADFDHGREVVHEKALLNKRFTFANAALDADGIVSLPKLKSHGLVRMTGAVKNQFGCIPGILKGQFHLKIADPFKFGMMLVDINTYLRPRLYIMDGIMAMEGNGPRSGTPRRMEAVVVSADPVALDAVACRLINLDPEFVPTSRPGQQAGLGTYLEENIEVVGEVVENLRVQDFKVVRKPPVAAESGRMRSYFKNLATPRPVIALDRCTGCGTCISACPVGPTALDWMLLEVGRKPRHNYRRCIRCYCCQEMCPEGAISIQTPPLGRLVFRQ